MLSDTHCHILKMRERGEDVRALFAELEENRFRFVMDIGTEAGDFSGRLALFSDSGMSAPDSAGSAGSAHLPPFLHFSCGIWPDAESIAGRDESLAALERDVRRMISLAEFRAECAGNTAQKTGGQKTERPAETPVLCALGECGLDRYWNGKDAPGRTRSPQSDDSPGTADIAGEEELFGLQMMMARRYGLPVIVHSRDAFAPTLAVIRDCACARGVIHCFSYDVPEARQFLDAGFFISFPGTVTFAKKEAERERVAALLRFVPRDMLLLETDSPYLAPVPERGKVNTPLKIAHTYAAAAEMLGIGVDALAELVFANAMSVFTRRFSD